MSYLELGLPVNGGLGVGGLVFKSLFFPESKGHSWASRMKFCHSRQWLLSGSCVVGEPEAYSGSQIFSPALWKSTNPLLSGEPEKELLTPRCLGTNTCFYLFRSSGRGLKRKPDVGEQEGWLDLWILKLSHGAKRIYNLSALFCAANRESYTFLEYVFTVCDSCALTSLVFRALPGCFKNQLG